ncbi:MAG: hypothetical protein LBC65_02705 [Oscillospiraceae bacterium]|jgi:hypothetical protein|nr:hypothetical protein [Oscillospiraceae bacterium]
MTERIVELSDSILGLTKEQGIRLAENDFDGVNIILNLRDSMIAELSSLLRVGFMPESVRRTLERALDIGEAQSKTLAEKRAELSLEFVNMKRSIASVGAYELSSVGTVTVVGSMYDVRT